MMNDKSILKHSFKKSTFLVLFAVLFFPLLTKAQDTLLYQGWEDGPGHNKLHGFEQYNNQTWSQQNVWGRGDHVGINDANNKTFSVLNPSVQCNDSQFDSCLVSQRANFRGLNGAHIITGAITYEDKSMFNAGHSAYHTGPFCDVPFGCEGNTVETNVGLYSKKLTNNTGYSKVRVEFWTKVNGELNHDYGLVKFSTNRFDPIGPISDGKKNIVAPDDYWTTVTYGDNARALLEYKFCGYDMDTIYSLPLKPEGSTIPGQLQGYKIPPGFPNEGAPQWVKVGMNLPDEAADNPDLRVGFWWVNDNNGLTKETGFPALMVDEVRVLGYYFTVTDIVDPYYCSGEKITVPFEMDRDLFLNSIAPLDSRLYAVLTDSSGSFVNADTLGYVDIHSLTIQGNRVRGVIQGNIPYNPKQIPVGGYRVRVVAPKSGYESAKSKRLISLFPMPLFKLEPKDTTVCEGEVITLTVSGKANRYNWYRDGKLFKETVDTVITTTLGGIYHVEPIINGCVGRSNDANIVVIPFTKVTFNLPANQDSICYLTVINQLQGGFPAGGVYSWWYEGRDTANNRIEYRGQSFDSYKAGVGKHILGYQYTDPQSGCTSVAFDTLYVLDVPYAKISPNDTVLLCYDKPVTLRLTPSNAISYRWNTGETSELITVNKSGDYFVDLTNALGCIYRAKVKVVYVPQIAARPTIDRTTKVGDLEIRGVCMPGPVPPTIVYIYINNIRVGSTFADPYTGRFVFKLSKPLEPGDEVKAQIQFDTNCDGYLTAADGYSQFDVYYIEEDNIPNAFSPNGDGINDTWVIFRRVNERYPNNKLTIYNRYGVEVYSMSGYDNSFDGANLPAATYYYVFDYGVSNKEIIKGYVTIGR